MLLRHAEKKTTGSSRKRGARKARDVGRGGGGNGGLQDARLEANEKRDLGRKAGHGWRIGVSAISTRE